MHLPGRELTLWNCIEGSVTISQTVIVVLLSKDDRLHSYEANLANPLHANGLIRS